MNATVKNIISHGICIIIGLVIGGVSTGLGVYFYTQKTIDQYKQSLNTTNERIRKLEIDLQSARENNQRLKESIDKSIWISDKLRNTIESGKSGLDGIERINKELRNYIEGILNAK